MKLGYMCMFPSSLLPRRHNGGGGVGKVTILLLFLQITFLILQSTEKYRQIVNKCRMG